MVFSGNYSVDSTRNAIRNAGGSGWDCQIFKGYARITATPAVSWQVLDETTDQPLVVPGSANSPIFFSRVEFAIERALVGTNGDRLKLGPSLAGASYIANSGAVASGSLAAGQFFDDGGSPFSGLASATTSSLTFSLWLHNGSNAAPAGTLALPVGSNPSFLIVPVRLITLRRTAAVSSRDLNLSRAAQIANLQVT